MTARSPTMVTQHDTRFVECRWWNDGWTVKTVVSLHDTGPGKQTDPKDTSLVARNSGSPKLGRGSHTDS